MYVKRKIERIKNCITDEELKIVIDKIYEDGLQDGIDEAERISKDNKKEKEKINKLRKKNPFALYDGQTTTFTKKFIKEWKEFERKIRALREEHVKDGASDTASREEQVQWVSVKSEELI